MTDYTPTTEEVRQQWGWNYPDYDNEDVAFDRWLAEVKAEAWSEGFDAGERDVFEHDRTGWDDSPCIPNPYKGENK